MARAQGDDRVTVGVVANVFRFEIGEHWPDDIFLTIAGGNLFTQIQGDQVNHIAAAGVEIGDHIGAELAFKEETIKPSATAKCVIAGSTIKMIGVAATRQRVVAVTTGPGVAADPTKQDVIASPARQVTAPTMVPAARDIQGIVTFPAEYCGTADVN